MWRLAIAAAPLAVLALALAGGVASQSGTPTPSPESSPSESASPSPSASASPSPEPSATPEVLPPAPPNPPAPQPPGPPPVSVDPAYPGSLRPGDWVRITGTDSCLNMRWEPRMPLPQPDGTTYDNVLNCLPDGFVGRLDSQSWNGKATVPEMADGRWWWHIVGQGWAADEFLRPHHQGGLPWPERPDLANAGLIAYMGWDNGIWLMNADATNPRPILAGDPNQYVSSVHWSPGGDRLAFSIFGMDGKPVTRIIDLSGSILAEIPALSEPRWSPNGSRISGIKVTQSGTVGQQMTPVVFDLPTGAEWPIAPGIQGSSPPAWSPDGNSLAFICTSGYIPQPDGTSTVDETRNCHGDGLRVVSVDGSNPRTLIPTVPEFWFSVWGPTWSPSGETISVTSMKEGGCMGYALIDVASGLTSDCISTPNLSQSSRGGCGSPGVGESTWTEDGRLAFFVPGVGQSGVFVHDPATGSQSFIPMMSAGPLSVAPGGSNLVFGGGQHIWVAGTDGSNLTLLAEGHSPAWQPQP